MRVCDKREGVRTGSDKTNQDLDENLEQVRELFEYKTEHCYEKPFACELCTNAFGLYCHLSIRMGTHAREKAYVREVCLKAFSTWRKKQ